MASGARSHNFFGQFRGLFKEFGAKRGRRAPPSGSAPLGEIFVFLLLNFFFKRRKTKISPKGLPILLIITMAIIP